MARRGCTRSTSASTSVHGLHSSASSTTDRRSPLERQGEPSGRQSLPLPSPPSTLSAIARGKVREVVVEVATCRVGKVAGKAATAVASIVVLQLVGSVHAADPSPHPPSHQHKAHQSGSRGTLLDAAVTLNQRDISQLADDPHFELSHNIPVQLVIVTGSVVVFAMLVASLAWLCRASSKKSTGGGEMDGRRRKNTWSPGGSSSIYTYSNQSNSSLTMVKDKGRRGQSALSPVSPMPLLTEDKGSVAKTRADELVKMPEAAASNHHYTRGKGWQLFDNPVPTLDHGNGGGGGGGDVESARPPPARRPSFIDRLLAHRADPNDSRLPSQIGVDGDYRKSPGGALLNAISGSLNGWPSSLRNRDNPARLTAVESDFEGTIGGRDGEIPMAKRVRKSQGRFACDESTDVPTPPNQRQTQDQFSPLPNRLSAAHHGTPFTPGLAGLGTAWVRGEQGIPFTTGDDAARPASFAELLRQEQKPVQGHGSNRWTVQSTIDQWVERSQYAAMPPPSRRGSTNSFLTSCSSQAPFLSPQQRGLNRVVSIRPHFAPLTTLDSWLVQEEGEGTSARDENSIFEKYMVGGSQLSSDTDFDRNRGKLWEIEGSLPPSYHSEMNDSRRGSQWEEAAKMAGRPSPALNWGQEEERLEEEKRQIDRHQKMNLKEKKRLARRLARHQQQQQPGMLELDDKREGSLKVGQQQKQMHLVLDMDQIKEEKLQLRLEPSFQNFKAPLFSHADDVVAAQKQAVPPKPLALPDRAPARAMPLSPPESPLTSASEGPVYGRRMPGSFLVESSRISTGNRTSHSGSQRSISHGSALTATGLQAADRVEALRPSKKLPGKKRAPRSVSRRRSSLAV